MKMNWIVIFAALISSPLAFGTNLKCHNADVLNERDQVNRLFLSKDFKQAKDRYENLCSKYTENVKCAVEMAVPRDQSNTRARELLSGDKCAEVWYEYPDKKTVNLYFLTAKKSKPTQ